ncbi:hypothetical protein JMG10_21070 [Nostoc ellipsosporum NOK]|nr:hypothetical protein [Nostoc ellipsosporum NOK]
MKKIFTISALLIAATVILTSCYKRNDYVFDEGYWLSQDRGIVVYSSADCSYYVVETYDGYSVLRTADGYMPYEGAVVYGNFSGIGTRDFYNYSNRTLMRARVQEYWLSYYDAQDAIDYYCGYYGKGTKEAKKINKAGLAGPSKQ